MKNKVYKIETNCGSNLSVQKVKTSIMHSQGETETSDEVCLVIYNSESDVENCCYLEKDQAIVLAEKILKIANGIKITL